MRRLKWNILLFLPVILLSACGSNSVEISRIDGYEIYENTEQAFKIQYPSQWSVSDESLSGGKLEEHAELFGVSDLADDSEFSAIWYDFESATGEFTPNVNLSITDSTGLKLRDLKSTVTQKQIEELFNEEFSAIFDSFKPRGNVEGITLGNTYFITYIYDSNVSGIPISFYQAITVRDDQTKMYTFSLLSTSDKFDGAVSQYETMLSTLEIIKE